MQKREILRFNKKDSIFDKWIEDNNTILEAAFKFDYAQSKLPKFIKDGRDLDTTKQILWKYFPQLKTQFTHFISLPRQYPSIMWLKFAEICKEWKIYDHQLSMTEVD